MTVLILEGLFAVAISEYYMGGIERILVNQAETSASFFNRYADAGDIYKNSEVVPLAFKIMEAIKDNFDVKMKGIIVKNIEGNRGKLKTQDIWKYRALRSDYYLFKHEYIFVFKKQ